MNVVKIERCLTNAWMDTTNLKAFVMREMETTYVGVCAMIQAACIGMLM